MPLRNNLNLHPMEYQAQSQEQVALMKVFAKPMKDLFDQLDDLLPESADKTVTLRKLQELRMQVNATIVLNGIK